MTYQKAKEEIVESSPQKTDAGKEELYLYSLRKMAEENVENNRTGLTNLHNINSFFYLCGEMIRQQPDKKYSVIISRNFPRRSGTGRQPLMNNAASAFPAVS